MNKSIISELTKQFNVYKNDQSLKWKARALSGAIQKIKKLPFEIVHPKEQLSQVKGFGKGIITRIENILENGSLSQIQPDETIAIMEQLCSITGVGPTRAKKWLKSGIKTINDVKEAIKAGKIKSTHHIDIGLRYYDDFLVRIPRKEIQAMEKILRRTLHYMNPKCILTICGSYRRGCKDSGDIDMIITHPDISENIQKEKFLSTFVKALKAINFIIDDLTKLGEKKYMGVCKIGKISRRIDIRCFNYPEYYAAMLYFTGSKNFNLQMRNKAIEKGYSLNEYGLKKDKKLIMLQSEQECFDLLDMEYSDPEERNI